MRSKNSILCESLLNFLYIGVQHREENTDTMLFLFCRKQAFIRHAALFSWRGDFFRISIIEISPEQDRQHIACTKAGDTRTKQSLLQTADKVSVLKLRERQIYAEYALYEADVPVKSAVRRLHR